MNRASLVLLFAVALVVMAIVACLVPDRPTRELSGDVQAPTAAGRVQIDQELSPAPDVARDASNATGPGVLLDRVPVGLSVECYDLSGHPVGGVSVSARSDTVPGGTTPPSLTWVTDHSHGRVFIPYAGAARLELSISCSGYVGERIRSVSSIGRIALRMTPSRRARMRVVDARGVPVSEFSVLCVTTDPSGHSTFSPETRGANGAAEIDVPSGIARDGGRWHLDVSGPAMRDARWTWSTAREPLTVIEIQLDDARVVLRIVEDSTDVPIEGATVSAARDYSARSNSSGIVELPLVLQAGAGWNVEVDHREFPPTKVFIARSASEAGPVTIPMRRGSATEFCFYARDGIPRHTRGTILYGSESINTARRLVPIEPSEPVVLPTLAQARYRAYLEIPGYSSRLLCFEGAPDQPPLRVELVRAQAWNGSVAPGRPGRPSFVAIRVELNRTPDALDAGDCDRHEAYSIPWLEGDRYEIVPIEAGGFHFQMPFHRWRLFLLDSSGDATAADIDDVDGDSGSTRTVVVRSRQ